ncbi:MAG: hypothetical protein M4579_003379 [Chaenotheca gracillima]|nr:MAG: hypothetical protein M4579_003379 [Chaenotheca gracillima]
MGVPFDDCPERPEHIDNILNGLDRYNPETTGIFQDYVQSQCDERAYDCYANLALLKLYQFNPHLARDETITNILVKSLTVFPAPDFSLCLHLLPPQITVASHNQGFSAQNPPPSGSSGDSTLSEAVSKLSALSTFLNSANYAAFWSTLDSDDLYADLVADVSGFEELMRVRIAVCVGQAVREVEKGVLQGWLGMQGRKGSDFEKFVTEVCGWTIGSGAGDKTIVSVPVNKENEAKGTVVRENVKFDQFAKMIHRAYEQPA